MKRLFPVIEHNGDFSEEPVEDGQTYLTRTRLRPVDHKDSKEMTVLTEVYEIMNFEFRYRDQIIVKAEAFVSVGFRSEYTGEARRLDIEGYVKQWAPLVFSYGRRFPL